MVRQNNIVVEDMVEGLFVSWWTGNREREIQEWTWNEIHPQGTCLPPLPRIHFLQRDLNVSMTSPMAQPTGDKVVHI